MGTWVPETVTIVRVMKVSTPHAVAPSARVASRTTTPCRSTTCPSRRRKGAGLGSGLTRIGPRASRL